MSAKRTTRPEFVAAVAAELEPAPLRTPAEERQWGAGWMAWARDVEAQLQEALRAQGATFVQLQEAKRLLAAKDQSFRPPPPGLA
jgi:hypothetical protein